MTIPARAANPHWSALAAMLLASAVLSGCIPRFLAADDRAKLCRVAVEEDSDAFAYKPNAFFDVVGGPLRGAAGGAGMAVIGLLNPLFLPLSPMVLGHGMACSESARLHPHAQTTFQKLAQEANRGMLRRALEAEIDAHLAACRESGASAALALPPDAVVHLDRVEYMMTCPVDGSGYTVTAKWRAVAVPGNRVLRDATTICHFWSAKNVDEWAVDVGRARVEFERVLAKTGQHIAAEFLATEELAGCRIMEDGESTVR